MVRQGSGKEKNLLAGDPDRPKGTDTRSRSQEVICLADCPLLPLDSGSSLASELTHWHMPRNQHASRSQVARVGGYTGTTYSLRGARRSPLPAATTSSLQLEISADPSKQDSPN